MHKSSLFLSSSILVIFLLTFACAPKNRMFQTSREYRVDSIQKQLEDAEKNYVIQKNDYIGLQVYSNGGERIVDPDNELTKESGSAVKGEESIKYLIRVDGTADLPMIGNVKLAGFTLHEADSVLSVMYTKYYKSPFVITRLLNKRVVVLGPVSSGLGISVSGKIIPLENENMNLIEVIALYGGITDRGKSYNIRLIRGDLKNPDVSIIDLSTIEGMKKANLAVCPNDIIYIEQTRKSVIESVREIAPIVSIVTSLLLTIIVVLRN